MSCARAASGLSVILLLCALAAPADAQRYYFPRRHGSNAGGVVAPGATPGEACDNVAAFNNWSQPPNSYQLEPVNASVWSCMLYTNGVARPNFAQPSVSLAT